MLMQDVFITAISKYLPYRPISNDEMESILGLVGNKPSKVRSIILRNNGIKTRHYSFGEGNSSLSNTELTANAIKGLFNHASGMEKIELLACGTTSPDQTLPSHASMVHGNLGLPPIEISSFSGACNSGMQALKYAYLAVRANDVQSAVATGSERMSRYMTADKFQVEVDKVKEIEENGYIAFEKDFLRWMLSDGAGAVLMSSQPNEMGVSLKIEWIDSASFAGQMETCMYAGAVKDDAGKVIGYNDVPVEKWLSESVFAVKQDTRLLGENIVKLGSQFLRKVLHKRKLDLLSIDWFLPHLSSEFFRGKIFEDLQANGLHIPLEKWFTNLDRVGNVGAASPYLMLEELLNNKRLKKGENILIMVPESARFSYTYVLMTVV